MVYLPPAFAGRAAGHPALSFSGVGLADAGDKGISAAAIKSIKQRIRGDR
jgi:hypothetical protein